MAEALPEIVPAGILALLDKVYQTGQTYFGYEVPLTIAGPDGRPPTERYFTFTYQAFRESGQIVGISTFAYEVTGQVEARRERERERQQLQDLFEQAPVAICLFKGDTYVLDIVNPPMGQMLGRSPDQLLGKPFFEALPELIGQGLAELLDEVRLTGVAFVAQEQPLQLARHCPGEKGYFNFVYQPLRDQHGQLTGITCIAIEVTEQVVSRHQVEQLNQELATANEELQASSEEIRATNEELLFTNDQLTRTNMDLERTNRDLDNFVYTASHDLKAPILNIEGLLKVLSRKISPPGEKDQSVKEIFALMEASVVRFKETISDLTDIARIQKQLEGESEPVDLREIVSTILLDLHEQVKETNAVIEQKLKACPTVLFPRKNLKSVVYNLLSNAIKYRDPHRIPHITLSCYEQGDYLVLQVQDNGLGMDTRDPEKIFGMFKRQHVHVEGTGIGLYIVRKIIENARGRIEVESTVGKGSAFRVYFKR